jgi:hypothetical protein
MIVGYCTGIVPNRGSGRSPSESRVSLSVHGSRNKFGRDFRCYLLGESRDTAGLSPLAGASSARTEIVRERLAARGVGGGHPGSIKLTSRALKGGVVR